MPGDRPQRIQLCRLKGWRMPPNTVKVSRPSIFGNPWSISEIVEAERENGGSISHQAAREAAVEGFKVWLTSDSFDGTYPATLGDKASLLAALPTLRGKNLACWCKLGEPCHADVLLEMAND